MRFLLFGLLLLALSVHCAPSVEQVFAAGILPNCQQLVYCENAALAETPLFASLLAEKEGLDQEKIAAKEQLPTFFKVVGAITEKMPIGDFSAIKRTQFCADWSSAASDPKEAAQKFRYLVVYELKESFTPEQVMALIAEESKASNSKMDFVFDSEQEILNIAASAAADRPTCSIAFFNDNKVWMIGAPEVLQQAVNKIRREIPPAQLNPVLQAAKAKIPAGRQFYLLFAPNDDIQVALQTHAPDSPVAPTLEEIVCATLTLQAGEKLALHLGLEFTSAQNASMGKSMLLDGFFMGMGRMYLTQQAGADLPMLKTMGTSLEGKYAAVDCELTGQDIKAIGQLTKPIFQSLVERAAQR